MYKIILYYLMLGVGCNAFYDLSISYIKKEEFRFNVIERIVFALVWPIYIIVLIYNFIKQITNGSDD